MVRSCLPLVVFLCLAGCIYAQMNQTCGEDICPGFPAKEDSEGNLQDQCCKYIDFVNGCCSGQENDYLKLIRDVIIGVSVGVGGLIIILVFICICCCCCICC